MSYLRISNKGNLEIEALTLLGASSKRGDSSKIGIFGSGNKYALSYLLRNNYELIIYSGLKKIELTLKKKVFREHEFDVICVNGKETSITTEFGFDWKLWYAIRELYSNAVDEGIIDFSEIPDISPKENETHIYIGYKDDLSDLMFNIKDYIARDKKVLFECEEGKIYEKHSNKACIYRKGIKCHETSKQSIYDYDFNDLEIGENRTAMFSWSIPESIWTLINKCTDPKLLRKILYDLSNNKNLLENDIDDTFVSNYGTFHYEYWKEALKDKKIVPRNLGGYVQESDRPKTLFLPGKLYNNLVGFLGKENQPENFTITERGDFYRKVKLSESQALTFESVVNFMDKARFELPYKVEIVEFDSPRVYGAVSGKTILLGTSSLNKGSQHTLNTLIEEYVHIKTEAMDETREFQESAIDEFIEYMKKINGLIL